jgi:hypothetical protein
LQGILFHIHLFLICSCAVKVALFLE